MADAQKGRTPPRLLQVKRTQTLCPSLKRVVLCGDALEGFPEHSDGAHIKLMFPQAHQKTPVLPTLTDKGIQWPPANEKPIVRTYSVGHFDSKRSEIGIDMVLHGDNGPASRWAINAQPGDQVGLAGPGGPERIKQNANWYILAADLSSFAALNSALNSLPSHAKGYAFMEVANEADIFPIHHNTQIEVQWLVRHNAPARTSTMLLDAIASLTWLEGQASIMLAGENSQVVAIRDYLLKEKNFPKKMLYAVPYWKETFTEEGYHEERHRIMDELGE